MALTSRIHRLWRNLTQRRRVDADLEDELRASIELLVLEKMREGLDPVRARRAAIAELRIEPIKERVRDVRTGVQMERLLQDVGYAWRHIRRSPGFALAAILTLALGVGANGAMFSIVNALTLRELAVEDPNGLIAIAPRTARGLDRSTPVDAVTHLRDGPLDPLCGYLGGVVLPVLANGVPVNTSTTFITSKCLDAFGVQPIIGRNMTDLEAPIDKRGARVALITHRLWRGTFNGDSTILGRTLHVNNVELEIIGVLPPDFVGLEVDHGIDIFTPFDTVLLATPARRQMASVLLGRLRPGVTLEAAEAELRSRWPAVLDAVLPASLPPSELANFRDSIVQLERIGRGRSPVRTRYMQPLAVSFGVTALLLLLACVNLGGLLLARLNARTPELSVRLALGGTKARIAQQMLLENLLLSVAGTALAVPLAYAIVVALVSFVPPTTAPNTMSFTPDARVLVTMAIVAVIVAATMSALPLWVAMRHRAAPLQMWDRTIVGATSAWGRVLLVAQIAVSLVLIVGAALLSRSLYLLHRNDLGIRSADVLSVRTLPLPGPQNGKRNSLSDFKQYLQRITALPGVRDAAFSRGFPRGGTTAGVPIQFVGGEPTGLLVHSDYVSANFFAMLGIPLLNGRIFTAADEAATDPVVVISESLARALAPDGNVIGRRITFGPIPIDQNRLVIGVVGNATTGNPRVASPLLVYRPLQMTAESSLTGNLLIETNDKATAAAGARDILRSVGRDYALEIVSVDEVIARTPASERMSAAVASAVGFLAVVLAIIGVHGVLAYSVSRRQREIGVRVALGATPAAVARGIVREGLLLTMIGIAIGLPLAAFGARSLRTLMFGISELDGATFAAVTVFVLTLGAAAGLLPARRAATVDPVTALRAE